MMCMHEPIILTCDEFSYIWNALEYFKDIDFGDISDITIISNIQDKLDFSVYGDKT